MSEPSLKCAYPGCTESVTGQCKGFGSKCGSYYCTVHSSDGRCYGCAAEAQETEREYTQRRTIRMLVDRYTELAEKSPGKTPFGVFFLAMFFSLLIWTIAELVTGFGLLIGAIAFPLLTLYIGKSSTQREKFWVAETSSLNPGFAEFYAVWKQNRTSDEKESLANGFVASASIALVTTATLSAAAIQENVNSDHRVRTAQLQSDFHAIRKKIDSL